jgi:hypothetical protein
MEFSSIVRGVIVPASVGLVFALSRRYLPATKRVSPDDAIDSSGLVGYVTVATAVSFLFIAVGCFFTFKYLNVWFASLGPKPDRILLPDKIDWMFFPIFGGATLSWELVLRVWGLFDRHQAQAYAAWSDKKTGFAATRLLRWMAILIALPVAVIQLGLVSVHDSFFVDRIAIGRFGHYASEDHAYSSVRVFETYKGFVNRDGSFTKQPSIFLKFNDGKEWTSWSTREEYKLDQSLIDYLTLRIGRPPDQRETRE